MKKLLANLSSVVFFTMLGWAFVCFVGEVGSRVAERNGMVGNESDETPVSSVIREHESSDTNLPCEESDITEEGFFGESEKSDFLALHAWLTHAMEYYAAEATPCRDILISLGAWFSKHGEMGGDNTTGVVEGPEGWLFLLSREYGHSIEDYQGLERFDEDTTNEIRIVLEKIRDIVESYGGQFCFLIAPNKENVYPEQMPNGIRRLSDFSRTDCLVEDLKRLSDVCVVKPKLELLHWKRRFEVYYPLDSHWNKVGGYIGTQVFLEALGREGCPLEQRRVERVARQGDNDLVQMANFSGKIIQSTEDWIVLGLPDIRFNVIDAPDGWKELQTHSNLHARTHDRLLLVGDSFTKGMHAALMEEFCEVRRVHMECCEDLVAILEEYHPDVVLWEIVERSADRILPNGWRWIRRQ